MAGFLCFVAQAGGGRHHHKAHTHGEGDLKVALDGQELSASLTLPGEDTVGFEGKAKGPKQKKQLAETLKWLESKEALVPKGGDCSASSAKAKWAGKGNHREIRVQYAFQCKSPKDFGGFRLGFKDRFKKIAHVEVTAVLPEGQKRAEVEEGEWNRK